jgi:hypothetical protein
MRQPLRGHAAEPLADGRVLVSGGVYGSGVSSSAETYDFVTGSWSPTVPMNLGRTSHSLTRLQDGTVLAAGDSAFSEVFLGN